MLLIVGFSSLFLFSFHPEIDNKNNPPFFRWDSAWYESISHDGYSFSEIRNSDVAFFPLYPYLVRFCDLFFRLGFNWTGFYLNMLLAFFAAQYLFELLLFDHTPRVSYVTTLIFLLFPAAFFLVSVYAESLFILLIVLSFYFARQQRWSLSGVLSALVAITKPYGILLLPVLLIEYYLVNGKNKKCFQESKSWLYLLFPLISVSTVLVFEYIKFGTPFAFIEAQKTWGRTFTWPWLTYLGDAKEVAAGHVLGMANAHYLPNFIAVSGYLLLLPAVFRKCRASYAAFSVLFALPALVSGTFTSFYRYMLPIFPLFIVLALYFIEHKRIFVLYGAASFAILVIMASFFVRWFPFF